METIAKRPLNSRSVSPSRPRAETPRSEPRVRTLLRPGQVLDLRRIVIAECLILDVSLHGARLRLETRVATMPKLLLVYDERSKAVFSAEVRWHRNNEVGLYVKSGTLSLVSR